MSKHAGLATIVLLASAGAAFAHADLLASIPAAKASVAPVRQIDLRFTEALEPRSTAEVAATRMMMGARMMDHVMKIAGKAVVDPADAKHMTIRLPAALGPGEYRVTWRAVGAGGHRTEGAFTFSVK